MTYLCLIYVDEKKLEALPARERQAIIDESLDYRETLRANGRYITSSPLQPVATATSVRVRDGKTLATDGPFAETKEQLGGFFLVEAADVKEAVGIAAKHPAARLGCIEVRPTREMKHS
jgi:hypothetical protein